MFRSHRRFINGINANKAQKKPSARAEVNPLIESGAELVCLMNFHAPKVKDRVMQRVYMHVLLYYVGEVLKLLPAIPLSRAKCCS
jgi:hypothetical protein